MRSERIKRQIERLLDEAEAALQQSKWDLVRDRAQNVLRLDPEDGDALVYLAAAEREPAAATMPTQGVSAETSPSAVNSVSAHPEPVEGPTSVANGRYTVKRFLGEGGKKKVYLAHDTLLDRDVAFALIKTEGLDDAARERITREAQAMGRLGDHPHIVTIHDIGTEPSPSGRGQGEGGQPYLVLPLMPGGDVEGLIEKAENHQLTFEQAIRITDQLCQALEHAHSKGIIHRDVKPGNVWLTQDGTAKLGDFGLAVAIDRSRLTQAGMMVGTVSYMPPEQALGGEITPRSDLYSVGCMLYEMVTGRPPFVGDDNIAIIGQHLNTPPVSPSWHRPDLPKGLEALILRLLEKDPNKRPASAVEVRQALASIDLRPIDVGAQHAVPSDAPTADNPLYRRTFVGREAELRQLQSAFDGALSGQGALAMVVGEPGIGKTALVEQLATYVSLRGGRTLVGHCYEEGSLSLPYLAFVEAMRSYVLAREPDGLKSDLGTGAADVARIVSEIRDRIQVELRPPGDPEDDRWRLFQSVTSFLRNAATVQPLLIVVEDLHWADRGTLDLLLHVARNLQAVRLFVVGTYRDVEVDRTHPLSSALADLSRAASFIRVRLRGLTIDEVHRMISNIRGQEVSWGRAEMYYRQTEGNPLFIQELLRYLVEEGLVVREGGRYALADPSQPEAGVPEGLRDVIGKRLSRLSQETNRLLSIAAVIGRDFRLETLRAIASLDEEHLISPLDEAVKVGVLEERSQVGGVHYRFAHAFFRQTLYEELSAPRRLRLHQEVARALEDQYAGRKQEHAAELAEHFANSTDREDLSKAVEYGELAAQRAMSVFDYGEAVRLLERTLDVQEVLGSEDTTNRCDLLLLLGEALMPVGEPRRAFETAAEEAFTLAEQFGDTQRASRACQIALTAIYRYQLGAFTDSPLRRLWVSRADQYAEQGTLARVHADIALGGPSRALDALSLARQLGDPETIYAAANAVIIPGPPPDYWEQRFRVADELRQASRDGVSPGTLALFFARSAFAYIDRGDRPKAEELWQELQDLVAKSHDAHVLLRPLQIGVNLENVAGRFVSALDKAATLMDQARELGSPVFGVQTGRQQMLRPKIHLGQAEEAIAGVGEAQRLIGGYEGSRQTAERALLYSHSGRLDNARILIRRLLSPQKSEVDDFSESTLNMVLTLEAAVIAGERQAATRLSDELAPLADFSTCWSYATCFARHLGAAAALLGQREEARAYYHQALEVCAKIRFRPEIALTRLQLAELLLEHYPDERAEALEHLDFAISEFRDMKMQPSLERALRHRGLLKA